MKKSFLILLVVTSMSALMLGGQVKAEDLGVIPKMSLSDAINAEVTDAIITDFDIPKFQAVNKALERVRVWVHPGAGKSCWEYKYTADPYSFYRHTASGEWRLVQTTSSLSHTVNTVVGGWAGAKSATMYYNPAYKNVLGGC